MNDKIVFIIDTLKTGGAETSLLQITSRFKRFKPIFVQLFEGDDLLPAFKAKGIEVISLHCQASYQFKKIAARASNIVKELKPVLMHSTLFRGDMTARLLKKNIKVPLVSSLVNNSYSKVRYKSLSPMGRLKLRIIQQWDAQTARRVDLFISNSESIKLTNAHALGIPHKKIKVIYRGRDFNEYQNTPSSNSMGLKKEFGLRDKVIFLNVSRLLARKGQMDLLKAFKNIVERNSNTFLLIAGEGDFRETLEKAIVSFGLSQHVKLLGKRNDVPDLLRAADYFVFPSHYEGLPGALIEAMMSRTPIIASDIPENLECVNENSSLLYRVGDSSDLSRALMEALMIKDWNLRTTAAYETAKNKFSIDDVARQYESTYEQLLLNK